MDKTKPAKCERDGIACGADTCEGCGWAREEENWRKELLRAGDLDPCGDGRRRLILWK